MKFTMLVRRLYMHLTGFVTIAIEGFFVERFMNMCFAQDIFLWNVKKKNSSLLCANISIKDFKEIKDIARKTKCKVKINRKKGVPFVFNKYKKSIQKANNWKEKISILNKLREESAYLNLSTEEQDDLFKKLMELRRDNGK